MTSNKSAASVHLWLADQGFRVMRFWNNEVLSNADAVLDLILKAARPGPVYLSSGMPLCGAPPAPTRGEGIDNR
ncbi:DUF559 domain-containing protein [Afipia sp. Root123D2]|uniref:DUF559 domain-containing protein n=1 Tax=Afipia sp. Root123D2 TaxID=1736436 RepID=UPI000AA582C6|nr:DUF559 domain-containing protein [Afipia sp. Root123D2]